MEISRSLLEMKHERPHGALRKLRNKTDSKKGSQGSTIPKPTTARQSRAVDKMEEVAGVSQSETGESPSKARDRTVEPVASV
jgi:hypothetical protein